MEELHFDSQSSPNSFGTPTKQHDKSILSEAWTVPYLTPPLLHTDYTFCDPLLESKDQINGSNQSEDRNPKTVSPKLYENLIFDKDAKTVKWKKYLQQMVLAQLDGNM
ncbi:hypothetical protein STEG23_004838 [Scotinomys teguina]